MTFVLEPHLCSNSCRRIASIVILDFCKSMTRLLPIFLIFFPKFQDTHWSYVMDIPRSPGILVIKLPCEVLVSAFVLAILRQQSSIIIYSVKPTMLQVVISIDLSHHGWSPQCTLSKLKLFSQSWHCRTFRNIVTLCPNPTFVDFHRYRV